MGPKILVLTGQSGSGKSTVIRTLEDHGYFCVDNVPPGLVEPLIDLGCRESAANNLALVMDVRGPHFAEQAPALLLRLRSGPYPVRLLYLEASAAAVIRRYSETRRRHPLDLGDGLRSAITREQEILAPLREMADDALDTSAMSPHDLRLRVIEQIIKLRVEDDLKIAMISFGFKYGLPLEADFVLDVRFLPNPYFVPELRELTGLDPEIKNYVANSDPGQEFILHTESYLRFLIPKYQREGRRYFTVAVGCTGGQHRSVAIAEALSDKLLQAGFAVDRRHRELKRT